MVDDVLIDIVNLSVDVTDIVCLCNKYYFILARVRILILFLF